MITSRDKRFLHTPPYAWEIGVLAAAGAIWQLLTRAEREEREAAHSGRAMRPPERTQA